MSGLIGLGNGSFVGFGNGSSPLTPPIHLTSFSFGIKHNPYLPMHKNGSKLLPPLVGLLCELTCSS